VTTRVLIVEDEPGIAFALEADLESEGYGVKVAKTGDDGLRLAQSGEFDLILLDVMLPGKDGFEICRALRRSGSKTPIILLTAKAQEAEKVMGLELGADDYLPKPFEPRELVLRCGALLRRAAPPVQAHREVKMGEAVFDPDRGELRRKGKPVRLTSSESALLKLFAANAGRPFSRTDLCTRLGVALERSIDVQVTRLRRKIEEDPKLPLYIQTVRGVGYVLVPDRVD
jgi:two-component system phosphate regulon response regulator OmpR